MFRTLTRKWLVPRRAHWRFGGKAYGVRLPPEMTPQMEMQFARLHEEYREAELVPEQYGVLLAMTALAYVDDDGGLGKALIRASYDDLLGALDFFIRAYLRATHSRIAETVRLASPLMT